ncbi:hypothetical protein [Candidatus Contubernalis alkaliaceticus]|uniref:hypothetical protein n=1 Tax=Candidatus Contubernalis alkaliaceticus TaxID=338645 RepID=UPI001F4C4006|nr:hypothetical protein [Candidatus Contubernalis alkalaceticus]UNC91067.1 hypothetical protein HUE98_02585 [Candidatus Contubernalis alkalaceticus]
MDRKKTTTLFMRKSFRSSYEISTFSSQFVDGDTDIQAFDRHGSKPRIVGKSCIKELDYAVIQDTIECQQSGCNSTAILCKSMKQAGDLYERIKGKISVELLNEDTANKTSGVFIMPIYMAKGLLTFSLAS